MLCSRTPLSSHNRSTHRLYCRGRAQARQASDGPQQRTVELCPKGPVVAEQCRRVGHGVRCEVALRQQQQQKEGG